MIDTIFALATSPGRAGIAVIRASGPEAWAGARVLADKEIFPRRAQLCVLKNPASGEIIDRALVIGFKAPASYTGEDVMEYHIHGGLAVTNSLISALSAQPGHRMAAPGEFTRRAFENSKMDLTEAEAVADLINAETQAQKIQALDQMEGKLSDLYNGWTRRLTKALAHLEADIEFPDEDLPGGVIPEINPVIDSMIAKITEHLNDGRRGERLRGGIKVAVIGAPNAGKSSLVNALSQREVAIVSEFAGTTRDIIEVHLDLGGYPVILADTAGLRPGQIGSDGSDNGHDSIESEGIRRALELAENADIKLLLFDGEMVEPDSATLALIDNSAVNVINKCDKDLKILKLPGAIKISAATGENLDDLIRELIIRAENLIGNTDFPALTRQHHRSALEEAVQALERSLNASLPELMAEDMRLAIRYLGRITGKVDVEDLLDVIFKDFCIGK